MALGAPPFIDPDTNGNPLLEWSKQNGQLHPALFPVIQKVQALGGAAPAASPSPTLAPPQPATPALTNATPRPATPTPLSAGSPVPAAPAPGPNPSPAKAELARLTHVPQPGEAHTKADTGASGIGQIHNPWARVPLQVLDALGSTFFPALTEGLPGTQLHHQLLTNEARGNVTEEANVGEKEAQTEHARAETTKALQPSGANKITNEFEKWIADNPQGKLEDWEKFKSDHAKAVAVATPFEAWMKQNPDAKVEDWLKLQQENKPVKAEHVPTNLTEKWIADNPQGSAEDLQKFLAKDPKAKEWSAEDAAILRSVGGDPDKPEMQTKAVLDKFLQMKKEPAPERPPHQQYAVPDPKVPGGYRMIEVKPGGAIPAGAVSAQGVNTLNTPTAQMRNMAEMAETVTKQAPRILAEVDALKDKLGAGVGRWNELWVNKAGLNDPDFAGLDQDLDLYSSALVRTHFGARGGQQYREALRKNFSEAQSPEDLKSRITHAEQWIEGYAQAGGKNITPLPTGGGGKPAEGGYQVGHKYGGMVYQGGPVNDKANWK